MNKIKISNKNFVFIHSKKISIFLQRNVKKRQEKKDKLQ